MKRTLMSVVMLGFSAAGLCQTSYWQDVSTVEVNREAPRTEFVTYTSEEKALTRDFSSSENYQLLNGNWKFLYYDSYKDVPASVTDPATDDSSWNEIKVPGNWELQGYGTAIYVNHPYEFSPVNPQPPQLPEATPVGVYRRTFTVDGSWADKDIFLNIAGAKSGVYVYVNGREVGYSEDSKDVAQFRLNDYLKDGENTLVLKIYRWSTGSYLECQDFWRISGIERDVYLSAQARTSIRDFDVVSTLDDTYTDGLFSLKVMTTGSGACEVAYKLVDAAGKTVLSGSKEAQGGDEVLFTGEVADVEKWSAEEPNLYRLMMSIGSGAAKEYVPFNVGFRRFEIVPIEEKDARGRNYTVLLVNGEPVKFKGVNVHEHNEYTGHYVSEEDLRHDLEIMRQNNINAVRTSHYPQPRRFYELCDEIGIYVYCEANIESHGMGYSLNKGGTLGNNPAWRAPHLDRINNMYEQLKNYPCVAIWSLGNEAGNGYNFYLGYDLIAAKEHGAGRMNRPICYERAQWEWNSDMYVPQYPGASWFESVGRNGSDRPIVPSEYAHAMGNSTGGLWLQWQAIYKYPNLQGAFIWDWIDQGFAEMDENGVKYWAYGGDYGEKTPSDANFLCNGIIGPDRRPHPAMAEVKYAYSDIAFHRTDGGYEVENRFYFKDLSNYRIRYAYLADGREVKSGYLTVNAAPQSRAALPVPAMGKMRADQTYTLRLEAVTVAEERLIPADFVIAHESFELQRAKRLPYAWAMSKALTVTNTDDAITVSGGKVNFVFDRKKGYVTSYKYGGRELLSDGFGLRPNFWRAPTDNDFGNGEDKRCVEWRLAGTEFKADADVSTGENGAAVIDVVYALPYDASLKVTYTVNAAGFVNVRSTYTGGKGENLPELPRLGMRFRLPRAMESFSYYGRGPAENYWDRNNGTLPGLYTTTAAAENYPYVRPQETGHHTDTEWIRFKGLEIVADDRMEFNVLCNAIEEYDPATNTKRDYQWRNFFEGDKATQNDRRQMHTNDIDTSANDFVEVCLDYRQTGVGGYDSWGSRPEARFTLRTDGSYEWGFTLDPR